MNRDSKYPNAVALAKTVSTTTGNRRTELRDAVIHAADIHSTESSGHAKMRSLPIAENTADTGKPEK